MFILRPSRLSSVEILLARGARTILWGLKTKEVYSYENELSTSGPLRISLIEMPGQAGHDVWYGDDA